MKKNPVFECTHNTHLTHRHWHHNNSRLIHMHNDMHKQQGDDTIAFFFFFTFAWSNDVVFMHALQMKTKKKHTHNIYCFKHTFDRNLLNERVRRSKYSVEEKKTQKKSQTMLENQYLIINVLNIFVVALAVVLFFMFFFFCFSSVFCFIEPHSLI